MKNINTDHNDQYTRISKILTVVKYLIPAILVFLAYVNSKNIFYLLVGGFELLIVFFLTNGLLKIGVRTVGYILNSIVLLLFNIQYFVMYFTGTFVNLVMLTNFDSIQGLSGKFPIYIGGSIFIVLISFLPVVHLKIFKYNSPIVSLLLALELGVTMLYGNAYSQTFGLYNILLQYKDNQEMLAAIEAQGDVTKEFYKEKISSARDNEGKIPDNPNVVVIFTEGLSQHIINDSRNIMPNIKQFQEQSLTFDNYYNHTFATYRGIIGQLYSGYQLENYDKNNLVSLQSILKNEGYTTSFINTEPKNSQFTNYLESFEFDEVINDLDNTKGVSNSLSDKQAYEKLYDVMSEKAKANKPFFTSIYTYGTHQTFDSVNKKFGNGKDKVLNKFYDLDIQFGKFLKKFNESKMSENTILIFTTDHSTFSDAEYKEAFPNENRTNPDVGTIPLSIYYKGMPAEKFDVQGRNSLSLAPTVLDYMDISAENYFLGVSLFFAKDNNNSYDTVFNDNTYTLSTDMNSIQPLSDSQKAIIDEQLQKYFAAKLQLVKK